MEVSLAKQLSGVEVLESLLDQVRQRLRMNGRFSSHMAYPGYRAEITVVFYPAASFIPEMTQDIFAQVVPEDPNAVQSWTPTVEVVVEIPVRPPNQVREEAGMPTPVLTQDANGNPVEKWVKKGKPPKTVVKGGQTGPITMVPASTPFPDAAV